MPRMEWQERTRKPKPKILGIDGFKKREPSPSTIAAPEGKELFDKSGTLVSPPSSRKRSLHSDSYHRPNPMPILHSVFPPEPEYDGVPISLLKNCVKCGKLISIASERCPFCQSEQNER